MTRLPAVPNVINNKCCVTFQVRSWIIFHLQGKHPHAPGLRSLARIAVETYISSTQTDRSNGIKRTIWFFIVEVYPVRYSKQNIYFITGSFDFPSIANMCKQ
jgi:hypothetical protein